MKKILLLIIMKQFTFLTTLFLLLNAGYCQKGCDPITTFPWTESFEKNGTNIPLCWTIDNYEHWEWNIVDNLTAIPPKAHSGLYQALMALQSNADLGRRSYLMSPVFDLSEVVDPVLSFWHIESGKCACLTILCADFEGLIWSSVHNFSTNISEWQKDTIHLPNKSNYYRIVFIGVHSGGGYAEIHLDDISISDGELSASSYGTESYAIAPNPVRDIATISGLSPQELMLYDYQGKVVLTQTTPSNIIDMSRFPQGLYFLHIISDTGTVHVQKLIKQ